MAYVLAAKWVAKEGEEDNVLAALEQLAGPSRAEPGCLMWQPHRDPEDPRVFFFYEQYADAAAFEAHGQNRRIRGPCDKRGPFRICIPLAARRRQAAIVSRFPALRTIELSPLVNWNNPLSRACGSLHARVITSFMSGRNFAVPWRRSM